MADDCSYRLKFAFLDQSPSYALGFEAGRCYECIKRGVRDFEFDCHTENVEQLKDAAIACGWHALADPIADDWTRLRFVKKREIPEAEWQEIRQKADQLRDDDFNTEEA